MRNPKENKKMGTRIYGASDGLIEIDGDVSAEVGYHDRSDDESNPTKYLVFCDDGTVLAVSYGKPAGGIWRVELVRAGDLFYRMDVCTDEDADPYSDQAWFKPGLGKVWVASEWEEAK